eukprot:5222436-Pyramimonas_sp.AAC.1
MTTGDNERQWETTSPDRYWQRTHKFPRTLAQDVLQASRVGKRVVGASPDFKQCETDASPHNYGFYMSAFGMYGECA